MAKFKLQRYKQDYNEGWYHPWPDGEWVKWEDVKPLLSHITETLHKVLNNLEIDFIR